MSNTQNGNLSKDCRIFIARYESVTRDQLPDNIRLIRPYKQRTASRGRRRIQRGEVLVVIF